MVRMNRELINHRSRQRGRVATTYKTVGFRGVQMENRKFVTNNPSLSKIKENNGKMYEIIRVVMKIFLRFPLALACR